MGMIRPLSEEESLAVLAELGWGRLAVVSDGRPYAVPMLFHLAGRALTFYTLPGRKLQALREHPSGVVVEADDIDSATSWRSVIVNGRFEESPPEDAARLAESFRERKERYAAIALEQLASPDAIFGRILIEQISGRAYVSSQSGLRE